MLAGMRHGLLAVAVAIPTAVLAQPAPPAVQGCVDIHQSPDYVPGVDAYGHSVAPADVPSDGNLNVDTRVFAEVRTKTPQVPSVGVEVDLRALQPKPPCPQPSAAAALTKQKP